MFSWNPLVRRMAASEASVAGETSRFYLLARAIRVHNLSARLQEVSPVQLLGMRNFHVLLS
jgi:hypothetical protein